MGILFFNDHPESFFPYSQIEVVNIPDPTGQGMEERIFTGPDRRSVTKRSELYKKQCDC